NVRYGVKDDVAVVGVAECCSLAKTMIKNPLYTTSYGLGEAISLAKKLNKKRVYVGLGGSATNDGGAGAVCALGGRFFNKEGEEFTPTGNTLREIERIELDDFYKNIEGMSFVALSDVKNPLIGKDGCSFTYAAQKGAVGEEIDELEKNMEHFAEKTAFLGVSPYFEGAGAAGGLGYCLKAFFGAEIVSGADFILDSGRFDERIADCDCVITGEGCYDATSQNGKVCAVVMKRAERFNKKALVFCGEKKGTSDARIVAINSAEKTLAQNIADAAENLDAAIRRTIEKAI
ncbi:MAG: glycerate kinase, partial [Christensenellales bacterium]